MLNLNSSKIEQERPSSKRKDCMPPEDSNEALSPEPGMPGSGDRIVVIGPKNSGKTMLVRRFLGQGFTEQKQKTPVVLYSPFFLQTDTRLYSRHIWAFGADEADDLKFDWAELSEPYMPGAQSLIICISNENLKDDRALAALRICLETARVSRGEQTQVVIALTKADLLEEGSREAVVERIQEQLRKVGFADWEGIPIISCSAKTAEPRPVNEADNKRPRRTLKTLGPVDAIDEIFMRAAQVPQVSFSALKQTYKAQGGGWLACRKIFGFFSDNSLDEVMRTLSKRAGKHSGGASDRTRQFFHMS